MTDGLLRELAIVWPIIFANDFVRYALAASILFGILTLFRRQLAHRRIQQRIATRPDIRREMSYSLSTIFIFSLVGLSVYLGNKAGVFQIDDALPSLSTGLLQFGAFVLAHDAYFYWIHRAMHHPRLFRKFHRVHHLSLSPTPWAAYSFAPLEAVVEAAFLPLFLLVFDTSAIVVLGFTTHMIIRNVMGHAGIEIYPKRWLNWPLLRLITTTTHHDLHHAEFRSNFGLYFTWWDRLMGTEHPQYRQEFAKSCMQNVNADSQV